jgi:16S rRNA (adenine1518-N6/adenine1519-N6)-dimethyltransferase
MPTLFQITKSLLESYNRYPRKKLGQHFLTDPQVLQRIIKAANLSSTDIVIEIGSGLGVISAEIAKQAGFAVGIEIDSDLISIGKEVLRTLNNIKIIRSDILDVDLGKLAEETLSTMGIKSASTNYKIIGNLPYYISAPIIEKIITAKTKAEVVVLMVQKEVAERMVATPGSKKYGSFSIFVQYYSEVSLNSFVSKSSFLPWPEVSSAVVVLKPYREPKYNVNNEDLFFKIIHTAFQQRRKMLSNSLKEFNFTDLSIDLKRRPETINIEEFAILANALS